MAILLHIDSSPMRESSVSCQLTKEFVQRWHDANPSGKIIRRDLAGTAIPVIDAAWITANLTPKESRTNEQEEILRLSTELTSELREADEYIIGVPMHNRGPSASFKLWMDQVVRFGETLVMTSSGPRGTLDYKQSTFVIASGRVNRPGSPDASEDFVEPWLRNMFAYLGVKTEHMRFIVAGGTVRLKNGVVDKAAFLAPHIQAIDALFCESLEAMRP